MTETMSIKMTARQYLRLGEDPPGVRLELVDGEIIVSPSPNYAHSFIDSRLRYILMSYIDEHDLGELVGDVDTIFDDFDVFRPDIIFIAKARLHLIDVRGKIEIAPDLCVEILSPSSRKMDRKTKFEMYRSSRVAHYWMVDPLNKSIEGYKLRRGRYVLAGKGKGSDMVQLPPFDDLTINLKAIWPAR